jgi:aminoglycoside phosphotransferase (APT) family kinase protein
MRADGRRSHLDSIVDSSDLIGHAPGGVLGPRLGIGRTAEVFAWRDGQIIKLLRPAFPDRQGEREAAIARRIDAADLAAPRFLGTAHVDGRYGLVYERVTGPSMLDQLTRRPWLVDRLARAFAELHAEMHGTDAAGLPSQITWVRQAIERAADVLGAARLEACLARLDQVAVGSVVCHGDLHPGNVVMTDSGPIVIDWLTAGSGPPEADVARTTFLLGGSAVPGVYPRIQRALIVALRRRFAWTYLRIYRRLRGVDEHQLELWRLPVLAARLSEGIDAERAPLLVSIDAELAESRTRQTPRRRRP